MRSVGPRHRYRHGDGINGGESMKERYRLREGRHEKGRRGET